MERAGRVEAAAQWLRQQRWWVIAVAFVVTMAAGFWDSAAWLGSVVAWSLAVVFLWFPGIETFVRNFRKGYRGEA